MKRYLISLTVCIIIICVSPLVSLACSTFCLDHNGQPVFGRNFDWMADDGLVIINKRHVSKTAATQDNPVSWTSQYGNITFNQIAREFPFGGMNEAGLVVEQMWLDGTKYPEPDERASIDELQWIQYQLDNFSTVEEVIDNDANIRISSQTPLHYLVCDSTGICATIEFLEGKMVVRTKDTLPFKVLTNSTYAGSVEFVKQHEGFGGTTPIPDTNASLARFARAAKMVKEYSLDTTESAVAYGFDILANIAQGEFTVWSIVYDFPQCRMHFRTLQNPNIRTIDMDAFDFSCTTPVKVLDMNADLSGDVTEKFVEYTQPINRDLIGKVFKKVEFLRSVPDEALDGLSFYPESTVCTEK